jgi:RNase P/RNase MRP subunit p29
LKAGSVFEVRLPAGTHGGYAVRIWGDNIIYVGSERTKVRFKEKYNLDLY